MTRPMIADGRSPRPLTGGYYWFPAPTGRSVGWSVLTCHDMGFGPDEGHYHMWPSVIDCLATAWVRDAVRLKRLLARYCYGLPRGRVTMPGHRCLVLHGDDAPITDWLDRVVERFDLDRRAVRTLYDEHEVTFTQDRRIVFDEFGLPPGPSRREAGEARC